MIDLKELKEIALANVVDPTSEYLFRYVCRWYSKTFHTPLHVVITELPLSEVLLAYFEEGYEMMDEDERFVEVMRAIDPSFDEQEEESIQKFIEMIEAEEKAKMLAKKGDKGKAAEGGADSKIDKANNLANNNTSPLTPSIPPSPTTTTTTVVRTYVDDTPSDEEIGEEWALDGEEDNNE